ncbi:MAG: NAD-dependent epimerase/dehydratase family protein, partial [Candidatus Dormibacteria bacterium]
MRVLVTGGAGFIGSHLSKRLLGTGHDLAVVDDLSRGRREQVPAGSRFYRADVASPEAERALREERPEVIMHLAAQIDVRRSVQEPLFDARVNIEGTVRLLSAAVAAGSRRFLLVSSGGAVYGDTEQLPTPEDHPLRPSSPYGAAKAAAEHYLSAFAASFGIEVVVLRPGNVYGPGQDPHGEAGVVAIFAAQLLAGKAPTINGDGLQTRDYVFVDDVVKAALAALEGPAGTYNLGSGQESSVVTVEGLL